MKRIFILLFTAFFISNSFSQISVGAKHIGGDKKFGKGQLEKFKKSTTIFVLNSIYSIEEYEKILKDSWTVTPFKVVDEKEFSIVNYLDDNYSFCRIKGFVRSSSKSYSVFINLDFDMYDNSVILKKLRKMSEKKAINKFEGLLGDNISRFAQISLYPKDEFTHSGISDMETLMYKDDIFFNYNLGLLKNYFQKTSDLLSKNEIYWLYESDYQIGLKELANKTLYVPSYLGVKYNGWKGTDSEESNDNIEAVFKKYEYDFKIIKTEELSKKILNKEDFYYIRYSRRNVERFINIVNSLTGEVVYRNYATGLTGVAYKLKAKHINDINSKISKALKKSSK